jgi:hypothetical protein
MKLHVILLDATKHRPGYSVQRLNGAAHSFVSRYPNRIMEWFAPEWVSQELTGDKVHSTAFTGPQVWPLIRQRIDSHRASKPDEEPKIIVFSYDPTVLAEAQGLALEQGADVLPARLTSVFDNNSGSPDGQSLSQAPISEALLEPAWKLALHVLEQGGYDSSQQALLQSALKPKMLEAAARLGRPVDLSAPGLISAVVQRGLHTGQLGQGKVKGSTGSESLWLKREALAERESQSPGESGDIRAVKSDPKPADSPQPEQKTAPTFIRCNQIISSWKKRGIYVEKPVRNIFFTVVEQLVTGDGDRLSLSRLHGEMATRAEAIGRANGLDREHRKWEKDSVYMIQLLRLSRALLAQDRNPILRTDPSGWATPVHGVCDSFRDAAEGYYMLCAIKDLELTERDHRSMAHACFREFSATVEVADMEERVVNLIAKFKTEISIDEEGRYSYVDSKAPVLHLRSAPGA